MDTDRNLLFGVLALQADLITNDQFAKACALWGAEKHRRLGDILAEKGWLTAADREDVEKLLRRKLTKHGGDAKASLADVAAGPIRESLGHVTDPDVRTSLSGLPSAAGPVSSSTTAFIPEARERYTLSRLHATGGLGRVWVAHDDSLGRDVALKELRPERSGNPAVWARFVKEAKVTGQLEHPGIVPVYGLSGPKGAEQPFYTMRFIRGRTLAEAAKAHHAARLSGQAGPLELRELLSAFVAVCNAVAYAHSRGVVHRDLKPQNVVLGDFGEAIVLDWGLAKLADDPDAGPGDEAPVALQTVDGKEQTVAGQVLGTPAYMAPEQAEGRLDLVGVRTDVYGLGATLYEVLTGRPPFDGSDTQDVLQRVVHDAPASPRGVVASVPPALEAICLKALSKRSADRYASASDLARDVQRWLADEPVLAHRESWPARAARWGRRHRTLVTASAVLLLTAVAALSAGTVLLGQANARVQEQRDEAQRQRDEAQRQRDLARESFALAHGAVDTYLTRVGDEQLLNQPGLQPLREQLLRSALPYYQAFAKLRQDDPALRREFADAYLRWGSVLGTVGSKAERQEAKDALVKAAAVFEELDRAGVRDGAIRGGWGKGLQTLAYLQVFGNQPAEGEETAKRALSLLEPIATEEPKNAEVGRLVGRCWDLIAVSRAMRGQFTDAAAFSKKAIGALEGAVARAPADPEAKRLLALAHANLANMYRMQGRLAEQGEETKRSVDLYRALVKEHPNVVHFRSDLSRSVAHLGRHRAGHGRGTEAGASLPESAELTAALIRENPSVALYSTMHLETLFNFAEAQLRRHRIRETARVCREAVAVGEKLRGKGLLIDDNVSELSAAYFYLAEAEATCGKIAEARAAVDLGIARCEEVLRRSPSNSAALNNRSDGTAIRAMLLVGGGRATPASQIPVVAQAVADLRKQIHAESRFEFERDAGANEIRLADLHRRAGAPKEALAAADRALAIFDKFLRGDSANLLYLSHRAAALAVKAGAQADGGDQNAAVAGVRQAVAIAERLAKEDASYHYDLSRYRALCAGLIAASKKSDADPEAMKFKASAIEALKAAIAAGCDTPHRLKTDHYFEPLRSRPDFQKLVADLEAASRDTSK